MPQIKEQAWCVNSSSYVRTNISFSQSHAALRDVSCEWIQRAINEKTIDFFFELYFSFRWFKKAKSKRRFHGNHRNQKDNQLGNTQITCILKINRNKELLQHLEEKVALLDPVNTLVRGYSITRVNGKAVTDASEIKPGIRLETELANGTVISTAENK